MERKASGARVRLLASWLRRHGAWLLMALTLVLFCTKTLFNGPLWLMAVIGLYRTLRAPGVVLRDPPVRTLLWLFLCIWIPQAVSLPDAVNIGRSSQTVLPYPHFFFAAVYMVRELRDPTTFRRVTWAIFAVLSFWCLDALLQFFAGRNLLGYPYTPGQLSGMFYPKIRLGHILAMLIPVYFEILRRVWPGRLWPWLLAAVLVVVLLLSGKRVAWFMGAVALAAYGAYFLFTSRTLPRWRLAAAAAILVPLLALLAYQHDPLSRRVEATLGLFSGEFREADRATAHRLSLWRNALLVAEDHWVNGVGPRGYRYVYREYAPKSDYFLRGGRTGQSHPHMMLMEIAAETGVAGIIGFAGFWWILVVFGRRATRLNPGYVPWLISAGVAWLPFNAHLAFYGSYWSSVAWWMLALAVAAASASRAPP